MTSQQLTAHAGIGNDDPIAAIRSVLAAARRRIVLAVRARRERRMAKLWRSLDDRTLWDIGVTRQGIREAALAERNEAYPARGSAGRAVLTARTASSPRAAAEAARRARIPSA